MKSSELVAGLFFRKVCLVSVPWCSGNTCLVTHVFVLWNHVFHAIFSISDQTCEHQSWYIHCKPRRSHDFSFTLMNTMTCTVAFFYMGSHVYIQLYTYLYIRCINLCVICLYVCIMPTYQFDRTVPTILHCRVTGFQKTSISGLVGAASHLNFVRNPSGPSV